jgi:hypothetical protein
MAYQLLGIYSVELRDEYEKMHYQHEVEIVVPSVEIRTRNFRFRSTRTVNIALKGMTE